MKGNNVANNVKNQGLIVFHFKENLAKQLGNPNSENLVKWGKHCNYKQQPWTFTNGPKPHKVVHLLLLTCVSSLVPCQAVQST